MRRGAKSTTGYMVSRYTAGCEVHCGVQRCTIGCEDALRGAKCTAGCEVHYKVRRCTKGCEAVDELFEESHFGPLDACDSSLSTVRISLT